MVWPPSDLFNFFRSFCPGVSIIGRQTINHTVGYWNVHWFISFTVFPSIGAPFAVPKAILNGIIIASFMYRSKNVNSMKFTIIYIHLENNELTHLTLIVWSDRSDEQPKCNHKNILPKGRSVQSFCEEWGNVTVRAKKQWKSLSISLAISFNWIVRPRCSLRVNLHQRIFYSMYYIIFIYTTIFHKFFSPMNDSFYFILQNCTFR